MVRSAISVATARVQARALIWSVWCDLTADPLHKLILTLDPDLIVLVGGLIRADGEADDLMFVVSDAIATVGGQTQGGFIPRGPLWLYLLNPVGQETLARLLWSRKYGGSRWGVFRPASAA